MRILCRLLLALLTLLPVTALAEEPDAVYALYHRALAYRNLEEMQRFVPAAKRIELSRMSAAQKEAAVLMMSMDMPRAFVLKDKVMSADGRSARLAVTGQGEPQGGAAGETLYGNVRMIQEKGEWKVYEANWSPDAPGRPGATAAPAAPANPAPKPAAKAASKSAPAAPSMVGAPVGAGERKFGTTTKQPCVYKPVMSAEDMDNCR